jgi:hypothetical protein
MTKQLTVDTMTVDLGKINTIKFLANKSHTVQ